MRVKCDHRSKFSNLSNWKVEAWKKKKKIRASTGFEPMTSAIPVRCSTNWAMKPHIGSKVNLSYRSTNMNSAYSYPSFTGSDNQQSLSLNLSSQHSILSVIPMIGPLHVSLNSREHIVTSFHIHFSKQFMKEFLLDQAGRQTKALED